MKKRTMEKLGIETSLLGFGCMRFPVTADGEIDEPEAERMLDRAIAAGVNYIDTAYPYHGGKSETFVGKALRKYDRSSFYLATKLPCWNVNVKEDAEKLFQEQLGKLQTDYIDFYLLHAMNKERFHQMVDLGVIEYLEGLKAEGKIKYLGFSFHDDYEAFEDILCYRDWDFCQIQLNYMDQHFQAGVKGLEYAASKGLGVIIMESLKGGRLVAAIPPSVQKIFDACPIKKSPAEWAFKWLANRPEVTLMLSGMGRESELKQNIEILSKDNVAELTAEEAALINQVAGEYNRLIPYPCTACQYCMPCPQKLEIYKIINYYNDWNVYEQNPNTAFEYTNWMAKHGSDCVGCGACLEKCPQHLNIPEAMGKAAETFGL